MGITMTLLPTLEQYKYLMKYKLEIFVYILIKGLDAQYFRASFYTWLLFAIFLVLFNVAETLFLHKPK